MEIDYRYTQRSDKFFLSKWLENPKVMYSFPPTNQREVSFFVDNWIEQAQKETGLSAIYEGKLCAMGVLFLMNYEKVKHHSMLYIIVNPFYQSRGIGKDLLKNMLNLAENYLHLESVTAEIFAENTSCDKLLKNFGFEIFAKQEKYVKVDGSYISRTLYEHFFKRK